MEKQIFLIRVNPNDWVWGEKKYNWDDLGIGGTVSFDGDCKNTKDIQDIKLHDIFIGYNTDHLDKPKERNLSIVCIGRIISDGCFKSVGESGDLSERFLIQKILTLKNNLPLNWMRENIEDLGANQPAVVKLSKGDWTRIKNKIILNEQEYKKTINYLENGWMGMNLPA